MNKEVSNYYNECLYILFNYHKIKNNPHKKVKSLSQTLLTKEIIFIVLVLVTIGLFIYSKYIPWLILTAVLLFLLFQNFYTHLLVKDRIKTEVSNKVDKKINNKIQTKKDEIIQYKETKKDKKSIKIESNSTKWDDVLYVIINKYTICYLPKKDPNKLICSSITEQAKILKDLDKYNRRDLLIDNSELYK